MRIEQTDIYECGHSLNFLIDDDVTPSSSYSAEVQSILNPVPGHCGCYNPDFCPDCDTPLPAPLSSALSPHIVRHVGLRHEHDSERLIVEDIEPEDVRFPEDFRPMDELDRTPLASPMSPRTYQRWLDDLAECRWASSPSTRLRLRAPPRTTSMYDLSSELGSVMFHVSSSDNPQGWPAALTGKEKGNVKSVDKGSTPHASSTISPHTITTRPKVNVCKKKMAQEEIPHLRGGAHWADGRLIPSPTLFMRAENLYDFDFESPRGSLDRSPSPRRTTRYQPGRSVFSRLRDTLSPRRLYKGERKGYARYSPSLSPALRPRNYSWDAAYGNDSSIRPRNPSWEAVYGRSPSPQGSFIWVPYASRSLERSPSPHIRSHHRTSSMDSMPPPYYSLRGGSSTLENARALSINMNMDENESSSPTSPCTTWPGNVCKMGRHRPHLSSPNRTPTPRQRTSIDDSSLWNMVNPMSFPSSAAKEILLEAEIIERYIKYTQRLKKRFGALDKQYCDVAQDIATDHGLPLDAECRIDITSVDSAARNAALNKDMLEEMRGLVDLEKTNKHLWWLREKHRGLRKELETLLRKEHKERVASLRGTEFEGELDEDW